MCRERTDLKGEMIRTKNIYFTATILIFLNGCVAYYPQVVDIPLIKQKGDLRINTGAFFIPNLNGTMYENGNSALSSFGFHATFSAGITDFLAAQSYASFDGMARIHVQGALGVYKGFENNTVIESYNGFGYGNGFGSALIRETLKDNYWLAFSQFNIGKTNVGAKKIDFGMGLKGGYLYTSLVETAPLDFFDDIIYKKNGWIMEPSLFFRCGKGKVKFNTTINYLWTDTIIDNYYFPLSVSMGVNFRIGKIPK